MKCPMCPVALVALCALAGGSLLALKQPDSTVTNKPHPQPGHDRPGQPGGDANHPLTNMPNPQQPDKAAMEEMMKAMKAIVEPGPNHKFFESWVGSWDTTTKMFMSPGAAPQVSRGHSEFKWLLEGRWLQEQHEGQIMGQHMQGFGLSGYDNYNKHFVWSWVDNLTTSMINATGSLDESGKVLTLFGLMDEPMTGEHGKHVRYQITVVDNDTHKLTIDEVEAPQPFTVVEVTYTRAK